MVKTMKELKNLDKAPKFPGCKTVGELIEVLQQLPHKLPVETGVGYGIKPVLVNGKTAPTLLLDSDDGTWDDD
jgi:hypothetical protein